MRAKIMPGQQCEVENSFPWESQHSCLGFDFYNFYFFISCPHHFPF